MKVLILTGGDVEIPFAAGFLEKWQYGYAIAVDGGLIPAEELGICPDCIVGDFDTVDRERLASYRERGVHFETHRPEKDCTDTELALLYALDLPGTEEIVILGAFGRRFDHALANVQILLHGLKRKIPCSLVDGWNRLFLLDGSRDFRKETLWGKYISFIPFAGQVRGVTLTGFKYPLTDAALSPGVSLGVSNELAGEEARLELEEGILICVESRDGR